MAHESLLISAQIALRQGRFSQACNCFIQAHRLKQRSSGDINDTEAIKTATELVLTALQTFQCDQDQLVGVLLGLRKELKGVDNCQVVDLALALAYRRLNNPALAVRFNTKAIKQGQYKAEAFLSMSATLYALNDLPRAFKYGSRGFRLAYEELEQHTSSQKVTFFSEECEKLAKVEERLERPALVLEWRRRVLSLLETFGSEEHTELLEQQRKSLRVAIRAYRASEKGNRNSFPLLSTLPSDSTKTLDSDLFSWKSKGQTQSSRVSDMYSSSANFGRLGSCDFRPPQTQFTLVQSVHAQSFFRRGLARLALHQQRLSVHNQRPLVLHCSKAIAGDYMMVSVYENPAFYEVEAVSSQYCFSSLIVSRPCSISLTRLIDVLEVNSRKQLCRRDEREAAQLIKRRVKGFLARRHLRLLQRSKEKSVLFRGCVQVAGKFQALLLLRNENCTLFLRPNWGPDLLVPAPFQRQSPQNILKSLKSSGKALYFEETRITTLATAATLSPYDPEEDSSKSSRMATSALLIQRIFRGYQVRRRTKLLQTQKYILLYRGCKDLAVGAVSIVGIYRYSTNLIIEAFLVHSQEFLQLRIPIVDITIERLEKTHVADLFLRLYLKERKLELAPTLAKLHHAAQRIQKVVRGLLDRFRFQALRARRTWKMQILTKMSAGAEMFNIAIYSHEENIRVELFKLQSNRKIKYGSQSYLMTVKDLVNIYGEMPPWEKLVRDLSLDQGKLKICTERICKGGKSKRKTALRLKTCEPQSTRRYEVKATSRLDHRLWVVTMYLPCADTAEFIAYVPGAPQVQTSVPISTLAATLQLPIQHLRAIGALAIYKLLKLKEGKLVLDLGIKPPDLNKLAARLQAYVRGFLVRCKWKVKTPKRHIMACIVSVLRGEEWVLYAYREPPQIHLIGIQRPSRVRADGFLQDSILLYFPPTLSHKQAIERLVYPRLMLVLKDGAYVLQLREESRHLGIALSLLRPMVERAVTNVQHANPSSSLMRLIANVSKGKTEVVKCPGQLLLRSGVMLADRFYLASLYKDRLTLTVQIEDQKTNLTLRKSLPFNPNKSTESQCEAIFSRLEVTTSPAGESELRLSTEPVLYRRSHYISGRMYHVTVKGCESGVRVEALDPVSKAALSVEVAEQVTDAREISRLVDRLKVEDSQLSL